MAYPTGSASAPLTGGTCGDAARPVVFLVHGYLASFNWVYEGVINHFTSTGNIVVMATYTTDLRRSRPRPTQPPGASPRRCPSWSATTSPTSGSSATQLGGGMLPWSPSRSWPRGWGPDGLWLFPLAPYQGIGTAPITLPAHTRAIIEAYDQDTLVDRNVGVDLFRRLSIPAGQKDHVTVRSSSNGGATLTAQHTSPNSVSLRTMPSSSTASTAPATAGELRPAGASNCAADLGLMGTWADGTPVLASVVTDNP